VAEALAAASIKAAAESRAAMGRELDLYAACLRGDAVAARQALEGGANVNWTHPQVGAGPQLPPLLEETGKEKSRNKEQK
jgi:hypothetical protein